MTIQIVRNFKRWFLEVDETQGDKMLQKGIVIGCDNRLETLLFVWYHQYKIFNTLPITFVDFGVSDQTRAFCLNHFNYITLPKDQLIPFKSPDFETSLKWVKVFGSNNIHREKFFYKPIACLLSPYQHSLWIDLDCLIYCNLEEIFSFFPNSPSLVLREEGSDWLDILREHELLENDEVGYNSGVFLFTKDHPVIKKWKERSMQENHLFYGDQDVLSRVLFEEKIKPSILPQEYNWSYKVGMNPKAKIVHFHGDSKSEIFKYLTSPN